MARIKSWVVCFFTVLAFFIWCSASCSVFAATDPTGVTSVVTTDSAEIDWQSSDTNASYNVYVDDNLIGNTQQNYFDLDGLTYGTVYNIEIQGVDSSGNVSQGLQCQILTDSWGYDLQQWAEMILVFAMGGAVVGWIHLVMKRG